jgi:hypothetical protein
MEAWEYTIEWTTVIENQKRKNNLETNEIDVQNIKNYSTWQKYKGTIWWKYMHPKNRKISNEHSKDTSQEPWQAKENQTQNW